MKQNHTLTILGFLFFITQSVSAVRMNDCDIMLMQEFMTEAPIGNGGINGHWRFKGETARMNTDLKRLVAVPTLDNETVFEIGAYNLLARIGEISLHQNESEQKAGLIKVSLKVEDHLNFAEKVFTVVGDYNATDGIFYVLSDLRGTPELKLNNFKIYYYPDSQRLVLQAKEWPMPVPLRLNHPKRNF